MDTQSEGRAIKHHWNSYNSLIANELRQNDLRLYQKENPHLRVVDPENAKMNSAANNRRVVPGTKQQHRELRKGTMAATNGALYSESQSVIDENEEDIYAKMSKKDRALRRDSNIKKSIIKSFEELQSQTIESSTQKTPRSHINTFDLL